MSSITYRLKSSNHIGTIDIKGSLITCREAEECIAQKLKLPLDEINIFLAGSTSLLHPEENIPAHTIVDVVRHVGCGKLSAGKAKNESATSTSLPPSLTNSSLESSTPLTEEQRLAQLQEEVTLDTGIHETRGRGGGGRGGFYSRGFGRGGFELPSSPGGFGRKPFREETFHPPPKGYICHHCGKGGHLIQHCPGVRNGVGGAPGKALASPIGIPESMLEQCSIDDPAPKFITRDNRIVKRKVLDSAFICTVASFANFSSPVSGVKRYRNEEEGELFPHDEKEKKGIQWSRVKNEKGKCIKCCMTAAEPLKTPCCGLLLCRECFEELGEGALSDENFSPDDMKCPNCNEVLAMDEVVEALEVT